MDLNYEVQNRYMNIIPVHISTLYLLFTYVFAYGLPQSQGSAGQILCSGE